MEGFREVLAGAGGGVGGEVLGGIAATRGLGGLVGSAEGVAESSGSHEPGPAVSEGMRPFVAEHVGEAGVVAEEEVGELGSADRRDVDVDVALMQAVAGEGSRHEPHRDAVEGPALQSKAFHLPGHLPVGLGEFAEGDEVPQGTAGGLSSVGHGMIQLIPAARRERNGPPPSCWSVGSDCSNRTRPYWPLLPSPT